MRLVVSARALALAAVVLVPSAGAAQTIRQLPRSTAATGLNDSALVAISDSAGTSLNPRTRAVNLLELKRATVRGTALDSLRVTGRADFAGSAGFTIGALAGRRRIRTAVDTFQFFTDANALATLSAGTYLGTALQLSGLSASQAVFTDGSKNLVSNPDRKSVV